jgi:tellurite resistance protein TerC
MGSALSPPLSIWIIFHVFIAIALGVDLFWLHKKPHGSSHREAFAWAGFWLAVALLVNVYVYSQGGGGKALDFLTGYLLELTLSMDNVFVFYLIFRSFRIANIYQHKILFWGILGAFAMRGLMIFGGIKLLSNAQWTSYLLGAILVISGIKILKEHPSAEDGSEPLPIRLLKRLLPIKEHTSGSHFFVRDNFRWHITPLFVALLSVEFADLVFAIDSVPAVLAITDDFFIVYTSNILAILGLRSMYVILSHGADFLPYLHKGLALVLIFVGAKFVFSHVVVIPTLLSLGIILSIIGGSIVISMLKRPSS